MSEVLVVGATGFLGAELCRRATERGLTVTGTTHLRPAPAGLEDRVELTPIDVTRPESVRALFDEVAPAVVFNAAYVQRGDTMHAVCADAPRTLAEQSARLGCRLVHVSTDLVFDGELGRPYRPDDRPNPVMAYGRAKLDGERAVLTARADALVARTSLIYGAPNAPQEALVDRALRGEPVEFFTDELRSPVHVEDLASALLDLAALGRTGLLHVASDSRVNRYEFACALADHAGADSGPLRHRTQDPALGPRPRDVSLDSTATYGLLGRSLAGPGVRLQSPGGRSDSS